MIYKVDFEGQACKQIKEKAESYQYLNMMPLQEGLGRTFHTVFLCSWI